MTESEKRDLISQFTKAGILGAIILLLFVFLQMYTLEPAKREREAFIETHEAMSTAVVSSQLRTEQMMRKILELADGLVRMMEQFTTHVPNDHDQMEQLLQRFSERQDEMWDRVQRSHRELGMQ